MKGTNTTKMSQNMQYTSFPTVGYSNSTFKGAPNG